MQREKIREKIKESYHWDFCAVRDLCELLEKEKKHNFYLALSAKNVYNMAFWCV